VGCSPASYCRQSHIDNAADDEKFVLTLQHSWQQTALKEYLGQRNLYRKNVVTELTGALAATGK
jgi:cytidine deaminase